MKNNNRFFNSYLFLRKYYNIPKCRSLRWCIVKETTPNGEEYRLGAIIGRSDKYIDIAARRIFSVMTTGAVRRETFEAKRVSSDNKFSFIANDGLVLTKSKNYLRDIYRTSWWENDLVSMRLY